MYFDQQRAAAAPRAAAHRRASTNDPPAVKNAGIFGSLARPDPQTCPYVKIKACAEAALPQGDNRPAAEAPSVFSPGLAQR